MTKEKSSGLDLIKALAGDEYHYNLALNDNKNRTSIRMRIITERTDKKFIKTKPGRGGSQVQYVTGGYVTRALNLAFGINGWSFLSRIVKSLTDDSEIVVKGILKTMETAKEQYGGHEKKQNIPKGDTIKAATTDALKKCASMIGIAGDVYGHVEEETIKAIEEERGTFLSRNHLESALENIATEMMQGKDVGKRLEMAETFIKGSNYNDLKITLAEVKAQYKKLEKKSKSKKSKSKKSKSKKSKKVKPKKAKLKRSQKTRMTKIG